MHHSHPSHCPKISVVMPVYNVERYVAQAIESVLAQTLDDWELIIVDDGGSDASLDICRSYDDPRIRIISQSNRGLAGARNTGIYHARAPFIALLDADDLYHRDKLLLHYVHLRASQDIGVSYSGSRLIDPEGKPMAVAMKPRLTNITAGYILRRNPVGNGSAAVLRKSCINRVAFTHPANKNRICWFDEDFRQSEDVEFWVRLATVGGVTFEGIEGELTDYRIGAVALSANIINQYLSWERMISKAEGFAPDLVAQHGRSARAFQLRYLSRRALQLGHTRFSAFLLWSAFRAAPVVLLTEPVKTGMTGAAIGLANLLGPDRFRRVAQPFLKGAVS
ncbi:MAG: glycosyltransferase family 2 protein [Sphingomonadaceae bacterium]